MAAQIFRAPDPLGDVDEKQARIQLAACYRLIAHFGMDDVVYTHVSARVPGRHDQFLINPYGLHFSEITASSLIKIDLEANLVEPSPYAVNEAGFVIHGAIHQARKDAFCVAHTHSRAGVILSCLKEGLLPLNQVSLEFHNRVAYHAYEGIALELGERERLIADLGDMRAMILRNHGLLTIGRTIPEAFYFMYYLDLSCRLQIEAMATGGTLDPVSPEIAEKTARQYQRYDNPRGTLEWPALLRLLDQRDESYKT
jgi:ribulose-5-phosphate 4-epimerase/fuculose-1-phosphate aldolase